jgi:hypothetical protein
MGAERQPDRFATRYANRELAFARYADLAGEYARFQFEGDPLADAFVAACRQRGLGCSQALREGLSSRAFAGEFQELQALLDGAKPPAWVDYDRINRGARTYQRIGPATLLILSSWSLINGYHCGPAIKPLVFTGQLEDNAARRLAETTRFVTDVTQVDALRPQGEGIAIALRVRIVHAQVRAMLRKDPEWREDDWGIPINQGDMIGTIVEFCHLVIEGARRMGFRFSDSEIEDVLHLWRYVAHLSGVDAFFHDRMISIERAEELAHFLNLVQAGHDEDSVALTRALGRVPAQFARTRTARALVPLVVRYHNGLAWALNGEEIATNLDIPHRRWRRVLPLTRALISPMEATRRRFPGGTRAATLIGNWLVRRQSDYILRGKMPAYRPVQRLRGSRRARA